MARKKKDKIVKKSIAKSLPRGKMPPGTRVHTDKKKAQSKKWCRNKNNG